MGDLSRNFSLSEFACRDRCGYGQPHPRLVSLLEETRSELGDKPLTIVSGIRCPVHNIAVKGAPRSRHQSGEASDIPAGLLRPRLAERIGFRGIGIKNGWVIHVDIRKARTAVIWQY